MQFFRFLFTTGKKIFSILVEYISSTMKNKKMCRKEERNRGREGEGEGEGESEDCASVRAR